MSIRSLLRPRLFKVSCLSSRRTISSTALNLRPLSPPEGPPSEYQKPSPPRLPKELQEEFERLQKEAETSSTGNIGESGEELHPDMRRPVQAEFQGDRNPVTGEVGGPKTEPTKHGDWSFGGRASDF
jgi:hypothetical protein